MPDPLIVFILLCELAKQRMRFGTVSAAAATSTPSKRTEIAVNQPWLRQTAAVFMVIAKTFKTCLTLAVHLLNELIVATG